MGEPTTDVPVFLADAHGRRGVCDDEVAFTGGIGIGREWEGDAESPQQWRDTYFKIEGPAVDGVHAAFYSDWVSGLLMLARERVRVTSAYCRPPQPFVELSCAAAARGVDVQVLVPGQRVGHRTGTPGSGS